MNREDIKMLFCGDKKNCFVSHLKPEDAWKSIDRINAKLVGYPWKIMLTADGVHLFGKEDGT